MPKSKLLLLFSGFAVFALLSFLVWRFSSGKSPYLSGPAETQISVTASGSKLTPGTFYLKPSQKVTLNITASDRDYTFTLPDWNLDIKLPRDKTTRVDLAAGQSEGTFTYDCGQGCQGVIIVYSPAN